jgi:hypothetical protein
LGVAGSEFLCLSVSDVARPQFSVVAVLVSPSAGLSPVSASPDPSFSPARELSTRVAAGFHFALRPGFEMFVGFSLNFSDSFFSVSAQLQSLVSSKFFSLGHSISHVFLCWCLHLFFPVVFYAARSFCARVGFSFKLVFPHHAGALDGFDFRS